MGSRKGKDALAGESVSISAIYEPDFEKDQTTLEKLGSHQRAI